MDRLFYLFFLQVSGIASLDAQTSGRIGMRAVVYYISTTTIAVTEGFALIYTINPSGDVQFEPDARFTKQRENYNIDALLDMFRCAFH